MASGIGSRRRLFASEDDDDDTGTKLCSLCGKKHCQLSLPLSWKSESAQLLVRSLQVDVESYVCNEKIAHVEMTSLVSYIILTTNLGGQWVNPQLNNTTNG